MSFEDRGSRFARSRRVDRVSGERHTPDCMSARNTHVDEVDRKGTDHRYSLSCSPPPDQLTRLRFRADSSSAVLVGRSGTAHKDKDRKHGDCSESLVLAYRHGLLMPINDLCLEL
jgi:hypothetical protein